MTKRSIHLFITAVLFLLSSTISNAQSADAQLWQALRSDNHFALIRHALAPGTGDPANFEIGKRDTQRNLSAQGREQAKHIGGLFRSNGIDEADVYSSEWFRCLDTAELLELGDVTPLPIINSFFRNVDQRDASTQALIDWLLQQSIIKPLVLVTHQVNITALSGVYPASGEIVVMKRGANQQLAVIGSIKTRE
ncbi:MAG: histidine phosphatase family protein [Pseudomonadota bacterium]